MRDQEKKSLYYGFSFSFQLFLFLLYPCQCQLFISPCLWLFYDFFGLACPLLHDTQHWGEFEHSKADVQLGIYDRKFSGLNSRCGLWNLFCSFLVIFWEILQKHCAQHGINIPQVQQCISSYHNVMPGHGWYLVEWPNRNAPCCKDFPFFLFVFSSLSKAISVTAELFQLFLNVSEMTLPEIWLSFITH